MSRSRLGLEAERLGSRLGLGHEGLVSIPAHFWQCPFLYKDKHLYKSSSQRSIRDTNADM